MNVQHVIVYRDRDRYAGWPANYGIWSWGNEIVVGFTAGYNDNTGTFHTRDKGRPFEPMQARSGDGGLTWRVQRTPCLTPGNRAFSADEHVNPDLSAQRALEQGMENAPRPCPGHLSFAHPNFALMCARTGLGEGTVAWFYSSYDRCHSWDGPYSLPMFGQPGIEARTDYLVSGARECNLFLTASGAQRAEGRGVFVARTADGGATFSLSSWVAQVDDGFVIMPASVRIGPAHIIVALRCRNATQSGPDVRNWIDLYASEDNGLTWRYMNRPVADTGRGGNPPAMIRLRDGRICLVYGYRAAPFGMRARLSKDGGITWGEEIILRGDAGNYDIGYPRAVQRPDGTVVAVYYYNDTPEGERYIAATLWKP